MLTSYMHLLTEKDFFFEVTARDPNPHKIPQQQPRTNAMSHGIYNLQVTKHNQCKKGEENAVRYEGWQVSSSQVLKQILTQQPTASPNLSVVNFIFKTPAGFHQCYVLCWSMKQQMSDFRKAKVRGLCSEQKLKFGTILSPIFSTHFYRRRQNVQLTSSHCKTQINIHGMNFDEI